MSLPLNCVLRPLVLLALASIAAACGGSERSPATPSAPSLNAVRLEVVDGNGQSAAAGGLLAASPTVRVVSSNGGGVAGVRVQFAATDTQDVLTQPEVMSGSDGLARLQAWRLGLTGGAHTLTVTAKDLAPVVFSATVLPAAAVAVEQVGSVTRVTALTSPLRGLEISVPPSDLAAGSGITVQALPVPTSLPAGFPPTAPIISITRVGGQIDSAVTIRIPISGGQSARRGVVARDAITGTFAPLDVVAEDSTSVTIRTRRLSPRQDAASMREMASSSKSTSTQSLQILTYEIATPQSSVAASSFLPALDFWDFTNVATPQRTGFLSTIYKTTTDGGICSGMSVGAIWYSLFVAPTRGSRLRAAVSPEWPTRPSVSLTSVSPPLSPAFRFASAVHASDSWSQWQAAVLLPDANFISRVAQAIRISQKPVLISMKTLLDGHAVVGYAASEERQTIDVVDPNYPNAARQIVRGPDGFPAFAFSPNPSKDDVLFRVFGYTTADEFPSGTVSRIAALWEEYERDPVNAYRCGPSRSNGCFPNYTLKVQGSDASQTVSTSVTVSGQVIRLFTEDLPEASLLRIWVRGRENEGSGERQEGSIRISACEDLPIDDKDPCFAIGQNEVVLSVSQMGGGLITDVRRFTLTRVAPDPVSTTLPATSVTATGFQLNGTVNPRGIASVATLFQAFSGGVCAGTATTYNLQPVVTAGTTPESRSQLVAAALPSTTYSFRMGASRPGGALQFGSCVSVTTNALPASLMATPASRSFAAAPNAAAPPSQTIALAASTGSLAGLTPTITYSSGSNWLTAAVNPTATPATLTLQPNTTALADGTYNATVRVTATGGASVDVAVSYLVTGATTARLDASAGVNQSGTVGQPLANPVVVVVRDASTLAPISGRTVTFAAALGNGTLSSTSANTDAEGKARVTWTLGPTAGQQSVTATLASAQGSPVTFTATARADVAARIVMVSGNNQSAPAGTTLANALFAKVVDQYNNGVLGANVNWAVVAGGGSFQPSGSVQQTVATDVGGIASVQWRIGAGIGTNNNAASASAVGLTGSPLTFLASGEGGTSPASRLGVLQSPSNSVVGAVISPAVQIAVQTAGGATVPTATNSVTVTLGSNTSGAILTGTSTRSAVNGVAVFNDLRVDRAGTYTIVASSSGLTGTTSTAFTVAAPVTLTATPTSRSFTAGQNGPLPGNHLVSITAASGTISGLATSISYAGTGGWLTAGLASTTTSTSASGNLSLRPTTTNLSPGSYTATVTVTGTGATSVDVIVTYVVSAAAASRLTFVSQPPAATTGAVLTPAVQVAVQSAAGVTVTTATNSVTLALSSSPSSLAGTITRQAVNGIATFDNLTVSAPGSYTLSASSTGLSVATSSAFTVSTNPGGTGLGIGFGADQFAFIQGGTFQMGQTSIVMPVHTVTLSAFLMQKTEVTQGQWRAVMTGTTLANPSFFSACGDACPVDNVSWDDIQQFLSRLNQQDPGKGYRLPTEAEWEYAARAGTTGDFGINGALCSFAWVSDNGCAQGKTWPVAQKPANAWNLHDMHGNVYEWVNDWYGAYSSTAQTNPTGPTTGSARVLRGGSWSQSAFSARSAHRSNNTQSYRSFLNGFRLARTP